MVKYIPEASSPIPISGYPARKTIGTDFAHVGGSGGLEVQIDAILPISRRSASYVFSVLFGM
ncbi:MAG: hypothetical protein LBR47_05710 [Spirochaetaceae bacterium]|nr:hypothetical protein [Spirochaetaceae bacterium]